MDDSFLFIRSLKFKDEDKVDKLTKNLHDEAFSKIDCLKCGNCCKISKPLLTEEDIAAIANNKQVSTKEIKRKYLEMDEDNDWTFNSLPCPFLGEENVCEIYDSRPQDCREFPHTQKDSFASRSYQHSANTLSCPAVYYIVEKLKEIGI